MAKRRKNEAPQPPSCPEWMVTFSDVISLLVTFFVLILTFSTLEIEELEKITGALKGSFGALTPNFSSNRSDLLHRGEIKSERERERGAKIPFMRDIEDLQDDLEQLAVKLRPGVELKINRIDGGLRIRIDADRMFDPQSDAIRQDFLPTVGELGELLSYYPNRIVVEGHTDAQFEGFGDSTRFPAGLELAGTMAQRMVEALTEDGRVPPRRVAAASYGSSRPIATNASAGGRARNRRVDILIIDDKDE